MSQILFTFAVGVFLVALGSARAQRQFWDITAAFADCSANAVGREAMRIKRASQGDGNDSARIDFVEFVA